MSSSAKSRNFRRRGDTESENDTVPTSTTTPSTALRKASSKPKTLLSFADDENDPVSITPTFSRKPSTSSSSSSSKTTSSSRLPKPTSTHKLSSSKDRLPQNSNVVPQAGVYTKEALLELQKNTRILAKPSSVKATSEPKIVLRGLLKPENSDHDGQNLSRVDNQRADHTGPKVDEFGDDNENENKMAQMGLDDGIPDEDMIKKIRAKRERLRQSRAAAADYISLDGGSNHGAAEGLSDEEPEFRTRIAMIGKKDSSNYGVFEEVDNDDDNVRIPAVLGSSTVKYNKGGINSVNVDVNGDGEDEEDKIWEQEQVRKALGKRIDDSSVTTRVLNSASPTMVQYSQQPYQSVVPGSFTSIGGGAAVEAVLSIPQQAEIARIALQENFRRLTESHGRTVSSLTKTDENLSSSLINITVLEKSLSAAGEKFIFMQKLRDFVSVICELLQHKAPYIEELEELMQNLHEQRATAIMERRTADNDDEMVEVEAAVKAAMLVFREHGSKAAVIATASSAAEAALAALKEKNNLPVKLDEFGRDVNRQQRMDMKRRAEARQQRKARFESKRMPSMEVDNSDQKVEGESSTDESDSESAAYQSNRDQLLQTADQIFSDASEEYSQLSVMKERFETWKKEYSSSYRDAYMSLSAPAIFSPYVRLELLKWDPLHEDADFFDMKWHSLLFNYGLPEDGTDPIPDDADSNLIPELVEKVAIPILHHAITSCWDMLSTRETKNAVSATNLVINYLSTSSEALAELLGAVHTRLADAVVNVMVPTWSPIVLKAVPSAARVAAYRFGMSIRLMRNICLWKDILSVAVLEKLALEELLCRKVLPHVQSIASNVHDAVTRTERIVASLSGVWAGPNVTGDRSRKLQPLVDYILSLGRTLEKKHASFVTESETSALARRLKKMLVELNDYDSARDIARTFGLKEAL